MLIHPNEFAARFPVPPGHEELVPHILSDRMYFDRSLEHSWSLDPLLGGKSFEVVDRAILTRLAHLRDLKVSFSIKKIWSVGADIAIMHVKDHACILWDDNFFEMAMKLVLLSALPDRERDRAYDAILAFYCACVCIRTRPDVASKLFGTLDGELADSLSSSVTSALASPDWRLFGASADHALAVVYMVKQLVLVHEVTHSADEDALYRSSLSSEFETICAEFRKALVAVSSQDPQGIGSVLTAMESPSCLAELRCDFYALAVLLQDILENPWFQYEGGGKFSDPESMSMVRSMLISTALMSEGLHFPFEMGRTDAFLALCVAMELMFDLNDKLRTLAELSSFGELSAGDETRNVRRIFQTFVLHDTARGFEGAAEKLSLKGMRLTTEVGEKIASSLARAAVRTGAELFQRGPSGSPPTRAKSASVSVELEKRVSGALRRFDDNRDFRSFFYF